MPPRGDYRLCTVVEPHSMWLIESHRTSEFVRLLLDLVGTRSARCLLRLQKWRAALLFEDAYITVH